MGKTMVAKMKINELVASDKCVANMLAFSGEIDDEDLRCYLTPSFSPAQTSHPFPVGHQKLSRQLQHRRKQGNSFCSRKKSFTSARSSATSVPKAETASAELDANRPPHSRLTSADVKTSRLNSPAATTNSRFEKI